MDGAGLRNIDRAASIVLWTLASSPLAAAWHLCHDPSGEGIVDFPHEISTKQIDLFSDDLEYLSRTIGLLFEVPLVRHSFEKSLLSKPESLSQMSCPQLLDPSVNKTKLGKYIHSYTFQLSSR